MKLKSLVKKWKVFFWVFLIGSFFITRLWQILDFPLFADEALYLSFAERIKTKPQDFLFPLATPIQPLFIWLVALFNLFIPNIILIGRLISVLAGFFTLVVWYFLLEDFNLKKERGLIIFFLIFSPFMLTYNRLAMLESLSLLGFSLGIYGAKRLLKRSTLFNSLLFMLLIFLGVLTKATVFFIYPLSFFILIKSLVGKRVKIKKSRKKQLGLVFCFLFSWLMSLLFYGFIATAASRSVQSFRPGGEENPALSIFTKFLAPPGHLVKSSFLELARTKNNFWRGVLWLKQYNTPFFFWLFVLASCFVLLKRFKKGWFFLVWFVLIFSVEVLLAAIFFPRYLFFLSIPMSVVSAIFLLTFSKRTYWVLLFCFVILIQAFSFDFKIIFAPEAAPWPGEERFQFFEDWTSGKGFEEIAAFLKEKAKGGKMVVFTEPGDLAIFILRYHSLLEEAGVSFSEKPGLQSPIKKTPEQLFGEKKNEEKYIIRNCHQALPSNWPVTLVKTASKSAFCQIKVYQLQDAVK